MTEQDLKRSFQERLLEGFERNRLRQEVMKAKKKRFRSLRQRYGAMVLGASLAVGGVGLPIAMSGGAAEPEPHVLDAEKSGLLEDLKAAQGIAREVTGGVTDAMETVTAPLEVKRTAEELALISDQAKEEFFKSEIPFGQLIYKEALKNDLEPELVAAVVQTESRFRPTARSPVGALGLMQLMPRTAKWMGANNPLNPVENVKAGTKYLKYLEGRFNGDRTKIIAAYNAGEGNVKRYGGVPPFKETRNYVKKVNSAQKDFEQRVAGHVANALDTAGTAVAAAR